MPDAVVLGAVAALVRACMVWVQPQAKALRHLYTVLEVNGFGKQTLTFYIYPKNGEKKILHYTLILVIQAMQWTYILINLYKNWIFFSIY